MNNKLHFRKKNTQTAPVLCFFSTMMQPLFKETGIIHWVVRGDGLHLLDMVTPTVSPHNIQSDFL